MKLFDEIEKCFPEMEKQWEYMLDETSDLLMSAELHRNIKSVMNMWTVEHCLQKDGELYQLFCQAGVENRMCMADKMLEWLFYERSSAGRS